MNTRAVFHAVCLGAYAYICYFDSRLVKGNALPIKDQFFSRFVWLTLIDLYLQTFYHLVALIIARVGGRHPIFHFVTRAIVGPVGMSVVLLFWALYLFDPNTLLADENAKRIIGIKWYNHGIHTLPLVTVLLDMLFWNHGQPSKKTTLRAISVFAVLYIIDIHYVYYISGFWAYPILGNLPLPLRALFIAVCVSIFYMCFLALSTVHRLIYGETQKRENKAH